MYLCLCLPKPYSALMHTNLAVRLQCSIAALQKSSFQGAMHFADQGVYVMLSLCSLFRTVERSLKNMCQLTRVIFQPGWLNRCVILHFTEGSAGGSQSDGVLYWPVRFSSHTLNQFCVLRLHIAIQQPLGAQTLPLDWCICGFWTESIRCCTQQQAPDTWQKWYASVEHIAFPYCSLSIWISANLMYSLDADFWGWRCSKRTAACNSVAAIAPFLLTCCSPDLLACAHVSGAWTDALQDSVKVWWPAADVLSQQKWWCLQALLLMLFPLHFFFHFLYYTDVGSLTFVLAAYLVRLAVFWVNSTQVNAMLYSAVCADFKPSSHHLHITTLNVALQSARQILQISSLGTNWRMNLFVFNEW